MSLIQYLLYKCEDITPLALQKALYYVQGFYYAFEGRFLFDEDCEAWVHGPVYRDVYFKYSSYRFNPIEGVEDFDESVFETSEKAILSDARIIVLETEIGLQTINHKDIIKIY